MFLAVRGSNHAVDVWMLEGSQPSARVGRRQPGDRGRQRRASGRCKMVRTELKKKKELGEGEAQWPSVADLLLGVLGVLGVLVQDGLGPQRSSTCLSAH